MNKWIHNAKNKIFIASYSGGKDSTLALYKAMQEGKALGIIVMMEEDGERSRSHNLTQSILKTQAKSIGLPIYTGSATWDEYEEVFIKLLKDVKNLGAEVLVTGDIDVPEHECWHKKITSSLGIDLCMPLWQRDHKEVVKEFINLGFVTKVVTVNLKNGMKKDDLGRILNLEYMKELEERNIDPCGEAGEFHTIVIDGPIFNFPLNIKHGEITSNGDYMHLTLELENT